MQTCIIRFIISLVLSFGFITFTSAADSATPPPTDFQGAWSAQGLKDLDFSLDLQQDGATLTGYHCGTTANASRIDCSLPGEDITIEGTITGDIAKVKFTSAYSGQIGKARITRQGDTLLWEITAFPNGQYYLPDVATLLKVAREDLPQPPAAAARHADPSALTALKRAGAITIDGKLDEAAWKQAQGVMLDAVVNVVHKPENWNGAADLSFTALTLWDDTSLYIAAAVTDDNVVTATSQADLLKGDHLEIWFDFNAATQRQKADAAVSQLGVGVTTPDTPALIRFFLPDKASVQGIAAAATLTANGYQLEAQIPLATFQARLPKGFQWQAGATFGLTFVVSDTDNPDKRAQDSLMATSSVKWGNPSTFGTCTLSE